jgi:hypothetical protein
VPDNTNNINIVVNIGKEVTFSDKIKSKKFAKILLSFSRQIIKIFKWKFGSQHNRSKALKMQKLVDRKQHKRMQEQPNVEKSSL